MSESWEYLVGCLSVSCHSLASLTKMSPLLQGTTTLTVPNSDFHDEELLLLLFVLI
jgi:hypothetical protein